MKTLVCLLFANLGINANDYDDFESPNRIMRGYKYSDFDECDYTPDHFGLKIQVLEGLDESVSNPLFGGPGMALEPRFGALTALRGKHCFPSTKQGGCPSHRGIIDSGAEVSGTLSLGKKVCQKPCSEKL